MEAYKNHQKERQNPCRKAYTITAQGHHKVHQCQYATPNPQKIIEKALNMEAENCGTEVSGWRDFHWGGIDRRRQGVANITQYYFHPKEVLSVFFLYHLSALQTT